MGDDGASSQNQRKRRPERESCINNIKLNHRRGSRPSIDNNTYTKRPGSRVPRGSLENVSTNPWGEQAEQSGTLRRCHSLAISRNDIFTDLDIKNQSRARRAQLIPRAKLIERTKEPRYGVVKNRSTENLPRDLSPDYSPTEALYASINNLVSPQFLIGKETSYDNLVGLTLPNYYPDDTDNTDAISLSSDNLSKKFSSCDNLSTKLIITEPESIPYDDNIVLSKNRQLYDSVTEHIYAKPRTIRGPTPYNCERQTYYKRSYSSDSSEIKEDDNISLEHFETDKDLEEINENITETVEIKDDKNITNIEVTPNEEYKTIVTVDHTIEENEEEKNKHSHNYLREFLESQKGSKKPLQNFITKKLSNLSRKSTNLIDNRFYSLPDLAVTRSLKKCEKIDRKLRKNIKEPNESRFIVNIGNHFDIRANSNVPVDFEVKIAKVPRRKSKRLKQQPFLDAVKSLNETLHQNFDDNNNLKPKMEECKKEYQEKLGTMRNYWNKIANGEKCKIVDVQTKVEEAKKIFEPEETVPNKVQITRQMFEKKHQSNRSSPIRSPVKENCFDNQFESLNPNIVEIVSKEEKPKAVPAPEFDHVRYRVVKSDLFQKRIFANCEKESQFDGLMQYLQDYSFQELLRDNNIVIIEPIRTKIPHETNINTKTKNITPLLHKTNDSNKRHFFYHPIRVNKEMNDDELPNPDTVKQVREFFEGALTKSKSTQRFPEDKKPDPDKDHCSGTDSNSNISDFGSTENLTDSLVDHCEQYVSEDILAKIRECGTTVTYYGDTIVRKSGQPVLTKAIMEEIKNDEMKTSECLEPDTYQGVKFKLIKSNSCNSRLQLVGTNDLKESKQKYLKNRERSLMEVKEKNEIINENIKNEENNNTQPKIIGEERKMTQWGTISNEKTYNGINYSSNAKITQDYSTFNIYSKKIDDMEFEPYEVA